MPSEHTAGELARSLMMMHAGNTPGPKKQNKTGERLKHRAAGLQQKKAFFLTSEMSMETK